MRLSPGHFPDMKLAFSSNAYIAFLDRRDDRDDRGSRL